MCSPLNCGTSNFPAEEYDIDELLNPCTPPKKASKKMKHNKNNPFANRGLDKFNALLSELESKKQKIYTQKGSQDISFIRFSYSASSGVWKPIVVKAKGRIRSNQHEHHRLSDIDNQVHHQEHHHVDRAQTNNGEIIINSNRSRSRGSFFKLENMRQPSFYLTMLLILILLFLAISSKTFAILCTTIGWYLLPLIEEVSSSSGGNHVDTPLKKIEYTRKLSDGHIILTGSASPLSVLDGPQSMSPAAKHAHRKSW